MTGIDQHPAHKTTNALPPAARRLLEHLIAEHLGATFPAATLVAVQLGEVMFSGAWGYLDPETRQVPTHADSLFDLASVSKLFTAAALLTLVSAGVFDLDDPLVTVIPEFGASGPRPLDGGMDPHTKAFLPVPDEAMGRTVDPARVTLRHLLTHTSGLAPWRDVFNAAGAPPFPPGEIDPHPRAVRWARALAALCGYPFVGEPGRGEVLYSDLGLMLLGEVTVRGAGQPGTLDAVIRERVTQPLRLTSLTFNPLQSGVPRTTIAPTEDDAGWRGRRCWGEVHDENACGVGGVAGHAGLFGTARDVAAFGQAWLDGDTRLAIASELRAQAVREQAASNGMRRGLGWLLKASEGSSAGQRISMASYGHTGFTGTSLWIDPGRRLVVALLTNRVYSGRHLVGIDALRRGVHDVLAEAVDQA